LDPRFKLNPYRARFPEKFERARELLIREVWFITNLDNPAWQFYRSKLMMWKLRHNILHLPHRLPHILLHSLFLGHGKCNADNQLIF
jgi:hypothetical protein